MERTGKKNWWFLAVNGLILILFGSLLLFFTKPVIETLVFYFGLVILVGGIILLLTAIYYLIKDKRAGMILFESIISIAIGVIIMLFPGDSLKVFLVLVGVWSIIIGVVQLVVLMNVKDGMASKNLLLLNGLLTIGFGVLLFFDPFTMAATLVKIFGVLAIIFGILMIYFSLVLKSIKPAEEQSSAPTEKKE
ncbi:MAG: DUF308 domain-containing protein [bacterium]